MEITIDNQGGEVAIALSGQFTFADTQKFKAIVEAVERDAPASVYIDISAVGFMDSAALGMMLMLRDICQKKNISLSLKGAQGQVKKIFLISKFDQLFKLVA